MNRYHGIAGIIILSLLITAFFNFPETNAAYTPDLSIVKVSPNNYEAFSTYPKYVPGYAVEIANYGSGASKNTTLDFYIKTFDNKYLKKTVKVPALNAGKGTRIRFSMSNQTDGSFKEGYVVVNSNKSFKEIKFTNNVRKFSLKDIMLSASNKTVTEVYQTAGTPSTWTGTTLNYTSPLSGKTGITRMYCKINFNNQRDLSVGSIIAPIPGYMHDNVTIKSFGGYQQNQGHPTSWNETSCTFTINTYYNQLEYAEITVTGQNLESKNVFKEPMQVTKQVWDPWKDSWVYSNMAGGLTRNIQEDYSSVITSNQTYTTTNAKTYTVHHSNVIELIVKGNTDTYYAAGWFITPKGTFNEVIGLYGNSEKPAILISNGQYGLSQKIRDIPQIGFKIKGSNISGFSDFKSLGFRSWTWKETY
ncbi:CARDB domain-containing protein [Methanobacterium sp.]|uniref:CARDB domain-containing protein n=1 Tax=Methanobacterium sp. TaxID=2164 RepID=UPI003C73821B